MQRFSARSISWRMTVAIRIAIEINRAFDVQSDFDRVFDLLADVPASTSFFPKLNKLEPLGDNAYRWEMERIGVDKHSIQTVYACQYHADKAAGEVSWTPVEGEGNGIVSGKWKVEAGNGAETHLVFYTQAELSLPLPSLLKLAVSPVVKHEFNSLVDQYVRNLQRHFS
jgi:ribosome-associated toxin RatA of RatAB toxin-antitoxin module